MSTFELTRLVTYVKPEVHWTLLRIMGFHWPSTYDYLLPSTTTSQLCRLEPSRNPWPDRLYWRLPQHRWNAPVYDGYAMGRLPIQVVFCPCSSAIDPWRRFYIRIRRMGSIWREISHVPKTNRTGRQDPYDDASHHVHLWSKLFLHPHVLAYPSF